MQRRFLHQPIAAAALFCAAGCAPSLHFNQSFLVAEELKLGKSGYTSLKSTGESFDFAPIHAQEPLAERIVVLKVHGAYLLVGDGFKQVWRLWPGGSDEAHYKPVDLEPGKGGFTQISLEPSGKCGLLKWQRGNAQAQAFITADGDADEKKCKDG